MASENAVMGDENFGTDLPVSQVDQDAVDNETKMAKFSKTAEYQKLKEHLESRIEFYQNFLPDGRVLSQADVSMEEMGRNWMVANSIVAEFKTVLSAYDNAKEGVDVSQRKRA